MFNLLNREFTFDVDVSTLDCGLNGALYFVSMDPDGGASKYPTNKVTPKNFILNRPQKLNNSREVLSMVQGTVMLNVPTT